MKDADPGFSAFSRSARLLGVDAIARLAASNVAVFGVGGVGSFAVEALVRSGIGSLLLVDKDVVDLTNCNRQLYALRSTIGRPKVEVAKERALDINPHVQIDARQLFYLPGQTNAPSLAGFDYVIDAIDNVTAKIALVEEAMRCVVPIVSAMGAGNKLDPTRFEVADIYATSVCPLCKVMRRELKKRGVPSLAVVYSREEPLTPLGDDARTPGSVSFVPPVAGMILASVVVRALANPSQE